MRILLLCLLLSSCVSLPEAPKVIEKERVMSLFPIFPSVVDYSRKPIIDKKGGDFVVSDEFLANSLKYKQYADKTVEWKKLNNIK